MHSDDEQQLKLDLKIIIALLVQFAGVIWFAASQNAITANLEKEIDKKASKEVIELKIDNLSNQMYQLKDGIKEIRKILDK